MSIHPDRVDYRVDLPAGEPCVLPDNEHRDIESDGAHQNIAPGLGPRPVGVDDHPSEKLTVIHASSSGDERPSTVCVEHRLPSPEYVARPARQDPIDDQHGRHEVPGKSARRRHAWLSTPGV